MTSSLAIKQIVRRARIEDRLPGRAAGAPIFSDLIAGNGAERFEQLGMRQFAQRVLVEDRNLLPLGGIVERFRIDAGKLVAIPRHGLGERERPLFSFALNLRDVGARVRQLQRQVHVTGPPAVRRCLLP